MSAFTTILTAAAATVGAAAAIRHVKKRFKHMESAIKEARQKAESSVDKEVLEFEQNPETGTFQPKDTSIGTNS